MDKKIQTIFEILETYDEQLVRQILSELSDEERNLFYKRFGYNFNNPVLDSSWNSDDSIVFHTKLIPHMKEILEEKEMQEVPILDDDVSTISLNDKIDKESINIGDLTQGNILEQQNLEIHKMDLVENNSLNLSKEVGKRKGKKLQTVYELLNTNDKVLVNELIEALTVEEKELFDRRNGDDLDHPTPSKDWTKEDTKNFTSGVMRKLKYRMNKKLEAKEKAQQLNSIFEILKISPLNFVSTIAHTLSAEEKEMLKRRGEIPIISDKWTIEDESIFLQTLVPKLQRKLSGKNNSSKAGEKLVSIYKLLGINDRDLIMEIVSKLSIQEKVLFKRRNGDDLDNPKPSEDWTSDDTKSFNQKVLPKLRRILAEDYNIQTKKLPYLKTMFQLLNTEDESLILELKEQLPAEEKLLFDRRNGTDLKNPRPSDDWTAEDTANFNDKVVKRMQRLLIRKQNGQVSRYLSIFKLLNTTDINLVQRVINRLTPKEKELFWKRNGNDLNNPMPSDDFNALDQDRFNVNLMLKMRKLMNEEKAKQTRQIEILDINQVDNHNEDNKPIKTTEIINEKQCPDKGLPYFDKVLRDLPIKEAAITSLRLTFGLSTNEISKFFNIEIMEITNIVKNALNTYKIYFTQYIDNLIEEKQMPILAQEENNAIENLSFGYLLDRMSLKEAIVLCLSLGFVNKKRYSTDEISLFLTTNKIDIIRMNNKALLTYKQIINDSINKVIDEMSDHEEHRKW